MCSCYLIFAVLVVIFSEPVMSSWEFAVSSKGRIHFYTHDWALVTSGAQQFEELSAIAFDEIEETLYFNVQDHQLNDTIFSLKLSQDENHVVSRIVKKTKREMIQGIAFDPLERILYWTDAANGIIYQMSLSGNQEPTVFRKDLKMPYGISIDVCRRQLYWTEAKPQEQSIWRISLSGENAERIIDENLTMPRAIVVDQFSRRIFWIDDLLGDHFSVESAALDGSNRTEIVRKMNHAPFDVTVDEHNIYWTDVQENAVWRIHKTATEDDYPVRIQNFTLTNVPRGIINRNHFLKSQANNKDCKPIINLLSTMNPTTPNTLPDNSVVPSRLTELACLNDGQFDLVSKSCVCPMGYKGTHCEFPVCYNYCVQGDCKISSNGHPQCVCSAGYSGERCELDLCNNHCLNGGRCTIENNEPNCQCPESIFGNRCEYLDIKKMCTRFCNKEDIDIRGLDLGKICNNCSENGTVALSSFYGYIGDKSSCGSSNVNKTAIFVSCGVVVSLVLVVAIVLIVRRVYKPLRPRIKKTYVVRKNVTPTPLTCRPSTEQCEITIENCCNMNICDTPCFDPKVLQAEANKKEDKKTLLNHSEDLMY